MKIPPIRGAGARVCPRAAAIGALLAVGVADAMPDDGSPTATAPFTLDDGTAVEIRDRISPEALGRIQAEARATRELEVLEARDPRVKPPTEQSIFDQSTILSDGRHWTLVPKGSVLHVPDNLRDRLPEQPAGMLLPWLEFLTLNRSWLGTEETSIETASGRRPIPETTTAAWARRGSVVVAVHQGGAISVNLPNPTER